MDDQNKNLSALKVIKESYQTLFSHMKLYLIISYAVMLPLFIIQTMAPVDISQSGTFSPSLLLSLLGACVLLILFAIFLYRLFSLDKDQLFKVTMNNLAQMLLKSFLYSLALVGVLILAFFSLGLLFGLILSVINSASGGELLSGETLANIITYSIMFFMLIVIFRVQPTFISIALGHKTIEMKSAYYYTRDNNKNLLLIALSCYLPLIIITLLLFVIKSSITETMDSYVSFLISPLKMLPYALQLSAGSVIYKKLVSEKLYVHTPETNLTV